MAIIFPSLISADLLNLEKSIIQLEPYADGFHLDVMDNHFVPNLTWGPMFINAIAKKTNKTLFVHLMIDNPQKWPKRLLLKNGDTIAFHIENKVDHRSLIKEIKEKKLKAALAISPKTALQEMFPFLHIIDQALLMSVEPGFSGQAFLDSTIERLKSLVEYRTHHKLNFEIVMDGGINDNNIVMCAQTGAQQFGIAAGIFDSGEPIENIKKLKKLI